MPHLESISFSLTTESISQIRNKAAPFIQKCMKENTPQEPEDIPERKNQMVIRATYNHAQGLYILEKCSNRHSPEAKSLIAGLKEKCENSLPEYWKANQSFNIVGSRLPNYERKDTLFPAFDCTLFQSMLGLPLHRRDDSSDPSGFSDSSIHYMTTDTGLTVHRLLLFLPDDVRVEQVLLLLNAQKQAPLHEAIIYQSKKFPYVLSVLESRDGISAYPEHVRWQPKLLSGLSEEYEQFEQKGSDIDALNEAYPAKETDTFDLALYEMQWQLDCAQQSGFTLPCPAEVSKVILDEGNIDELPSLLFTIPQNFAWHCKADHWILRESMEQYHKINTKQWMEIFADPRVAWEVAHKLWIGKSNNYPMTYPAGEQIIKIFQALLDALVKGGEYAALPNLLRQHVDGKCWSEIQKNKHKLSDKSWQGIYDTAKGMIESAAAEPAPYESKKVYNAVTAALTFLKQYYRCSEVVISELSKQEEDLLEYDKNDFFPLLLLGEFFIDILLTDFVSPAVAMAIHLESSVTHDNLPYSGIGLAWHDANHKTDLYELSSYAYSDKHIFRLLMNKERHAVVCAFYDMFDRLQENGGLLKSLGDYLDIGIDKSAQDTSSPKSAQGCQQEVHFQKVALFILFHELNIPATKANFYGVFDLGVPSLHDVMQSFFTLFKYEIDDEGEPALGLWLTYGDWNPKTLESYALLPLAGESPMKAFMLVAWLSFCFAQYDCDHDTALGDKESIKQFAQEYLQPMFEARRRFLQQVHNENPRAVEVMEQLPAVTKASSKIDVDWHRLFSLDPRHMRFLNNYY